MTSAELHAYVRETFASYAGLSQSEIIDQDLTLAQIVARSGKMNNSLDLMEAFARTANALKKTHGVRVRLPTFPLDTPISTVLQALAEQLPQEASKAS
jgi:hypothetical protein